MTSDGIRYYYDVGAIHVLNKDFKVTIGDKYRTYNLSNYLAAASAANEDTVVSIVEALYKYVLSAKAYADAIDAEAQQ